ncbi:STAS domain-containing protein [Streptomyces sp. NPDC005423]|uniref:STAS domain-containing protein n=1 Tax=Streptomyces sp. NPDC005423 TaxID=3155343 RepID=UPI0033B11516
MADTEQAGQLERLSIRTHVVDDVRVVSVSGEIDHQTGSPLREALEGPDGTAPRVVVDLSEVGFMDSSGINVLIAVHHTLTGAGGWLRLAGATPPVLRIVQLVGLDAVIPCAPTLQQALDG